MHSSQKPHYPKFKDGIINAVIYMNIQDNCTILAPANYHLPLYQEIINEKKDCLGIQVLTLSTWLSSFYHGQTKSDIEILYLYKNALETISNTNAFYSSIEDYDFLKACLNFIKMAKTFQIHEFPNSTQKEKDLHEILDCLYPIEMKEDQSKGVKENISDLSNLYILKKEYSLIDMYWIQTLLDNGARWLGEKNIETTHYISCVNPRKQMEVIADEILEKGYSAESIFIALNDTNNQDILLHVLDAHKIPYTLLSQDRTSSIYNEWLLYLYWMYKKDLESFLKMIQVLYPKDDYVYSYFSLFPERFEMVKPFLDSIKYEANEIIDEHQFNQYKQLEEKTFTWIQKHSFLWNELDFTEMGKVIQNLHMNPTLDDLSIFNACVNLIQESKEYIHDSSDLSILMEVLKHSSITFATSTIQGVLIGSRQDITALRPIVFLADTYAAKFPALTLQSGIFDESYVSNTKLPNLESRIQSQQEQIFDCLSLAQSLYVLYPQSDCQGKNNEQSLEMKNWIQKEPVFKTICDSFVWDEPNIDFDEKLAKEIFIKDNKFNGSISRLENYARCPFSHALKYGLHLKEKKDITDIRIRGSILHHILETIAKKKGKNYIDVSKDEIRNYVEDEFRFVRKIFYTKENYFLSQIEEITDKLALIFTQLKNFESNWNMSIAKQEYKFKYSYPWDNFTIELSGSIDRIDESQTSFCVFDYKSSDKDISMKDFESGLSLQLATYTLAYEKESQKRPLGCFYIALKAQPISYEFGKLSYRKKIPEAIESEEDDFKLQFDTNRKLKGWQLDDLSNYCQEHKTYFANKKDKPSKDTLEKNWQEIIDSLLSDITSGKALPQHHKDACKYCAYKTICRNTAKEIELTSRIEKEEA